MENPLKQRHSMACCILFLAGCLLGIHLLHGCSPSSRKGKWSTSDKENARKELQGTEVRLGFLGSKKALFISCYLEKLESQYASLDEANQDEVGCTKLASKCLKTIQQSN